MPVTPQERIERGLCELADWAAEVDDRLQSRIDPLPSSIFERSRPAPERGDTDITGRVDHEKVRDRATDLERS